MFGNLGVASGLHVIAIRHPEDECHLAAGWGGVKDHTSFNSNRKEGARLDPGLFRQALERAVELREGGATAPSFSMIPAQCEESELRL